MNGLAEDVWPAENVVTFRLGTTLPMSTRSAIPRSASPPPSKTLSEAGTS